MTSFILESDSLIPPSYLDDVDSFSVFCEILEEAFIAVEKLDQLFHDSGECHHLIGDLHDPAGGGSVGSIQHFAPV